MWVFFLQFLFFLFVSTVFEIRNKCLYSCWLNVLCCSYSPSALFLSQQLSTTTTWLNTQEPLSKMATFTEKLSSYHLLQTKASVILVSTTFPNYFEILVLTLLFKVKVYSLLTFKFFFFFVGLSENFSFPSFLVRYEPFYPKICNFLGK